MSHQESSLLDKLDEVTPVPLAQFDAFPKLQPSYKAKSESRGFVTVGVAFICFILLLNDIGEFFWGWPDHEFSVDRSRTSYMDVNLDMVVNMPCNTLTIDLKDAVGDRLYLSSGQKGFQREPTGFDVSQSTPLKQHEEIMSATQAVTQSRKSRGVFAFLSSFGRSSTKYKKTKKIRTGQHEACRIFGSLEVKKVTANLHITALGHGYASSVHTDHNTMNMSHIIDELSFGPFFPDIVQPLDGTFDTTEHPFVSIQYYLHIVPTVFAAPRSEPLRTNQYSVTHYQRILEHHSGTPGIYFKFDMEPMELTINQRTTTFTKFFIRVVGVIGGVFVCMGYAIRVTNRAVKAVTGSEDDDSQGVIEAEASGAAKLRNKWGGGSLRSRMTESSRIVQQGNNWVVDHSRSPSYNSPVSGYASSPGTSIYMGHSPTPSYSHSPQPSYGQPLSAPGASGLGFASQSRAASESPAPSPYAPASATISRYPSGLSPSPAGTSQFPPTPNSYTHNSNGALSPNPSSNGHDTNIPPPRSDSIPHVKKSE